MTNKTSAGHRIAPLLIAAAKWLGKPLVATAIIMALVLGTWHGLLPAVACTVLAVVEGVIFGFVLALRFFAHAITYDPNVFIEQYHDWKLDGRWDAMVAEMQSKRAARR